MGLNRLRAIMLAGLVAFASLMATVSTPAEANAQAGYRVCAAYNGNGTGLFAVKVTAGDWQTCSTTRTFWASKGWVNPYASTYRYYGNGTTYTCEQFTAQFLSRYPTAYRGDACITMPMTTGYTYRAEVGVLVRHWP